MANQGGRYEMRDGKRVLIERTQDRKLGEKAPQLVKQQPAAKPAKAAGGK